MNKLRILAPALALLAALSLPLAARPIGSINNPVGPIAKRGGLSIALNTSGWQFLVTDNPTLVAQTFSAEAILRNDSATDATFTFPDTASATTKFAFSILTADGEEIWHSDADVVSAQVLTEATLAARSRWSRALSIPLNPAGAALAPGLYTLRAELVANRAIATSTAFQVNVAPVVSTGISGQIVLPVGFAFTGGTRVSVRVTSEPLFTTNSTIIVNPRPAFEWSGSADATGKFTAPTPPGTYTIAATATQGASPDPGKPIPLFLFFVGSGTATTTVTDGALTPVTLTLHKPWFGPVTPLLLSNSRSH